MIEDGRNAEGFLDVDATGGILAGSRDIEGMVAGRKWGEATPPTDEDDEEEYFEVEAKGG